MTNRFIEQHHEMAAVTAATAVIAGWTGQQCPLQAHSTPDPDLPPPPAPIPNPDDVPTPDQAPVREPARPAPPIKA